MSTLICNLPAVHVWVRKEYLRDHKDGHGEFVKGVWVSAKSMPGRAFYFETYLYEYAALFDKLPISAFVSSPKTPDPDMNLPNLQFWNCMCTRICIVFSVHNSNRRAISNLLERSRGILDSMQWLREREHVQIEWLQMFNVFKIYLLAIFLNIEILKIDTAIYSKNNF